jgi:hypothetical protein
MGKKRRLKSARTKFGVKHANHPCVQHLSRAEEPEVEIIEVAPESEVVLQEEKVEIKPKASPKPKTAKTPDSTTRKKTSKKANQSTT